MITDLATIKRQAGMSLEDTTDDDILFELQKSAEDKAQTFCGIQFEQQEFTEYHSGDGTDVVLLKNYPVASITELYNSPDRTFTAIDLLDSDEYTIYEELGMIELVERWFCHGSKTIKVVYTAGYTEDTMPDDLKTAIASLVAADYLEKKGSINAIVEADAVYRPDKLRKEAYKTLDLYKRHG